MLPIVKKEEGYIWAHPWRCTAQEVALLNALPSLPPILHTTVVLPTRSLCVMTELEVQLQDGSVREMLMGVTHVEVGKNTGISMHLLLEFQGARTAFPAGL